MDARTQAIEIMAQAAHAKWYGRGDGWFKAKPKVKENFRSEQAAALDAAMAARIIRVVAE